MMFNKNTPVSASLFIGLSILTGLVSSFISPLMSYFIVDHLNSPPVYMGVYMAAVTISGLVLSQWLGVKADNGTSARKLYILASVGIISALLVFINTNIFVVVLLAGIIFMGLGNAHMPQMLTMGRQWAGQNNVNIAKFNGKIRAGISFSWMIGPPIGYLVVAKLGFVGTFSIAIFFALVGIAFVLWLVPELNSNKAQEKHEGTSAVKNKVPLSFWFLSAAVVMGSTCNTMYSSALPLYTLNELQLPSYTPGLLMGLVACLEIPIMLFGSRIMAIMPAKYLMKLAFVFAIVFYLGIFYAHELWHFVLLQLLNAIFYGLYAGVGLTFLQTQLPNRVGFTSAVYSNAIKIGLMFGATFTGIVAQFASFKYASLGSACAASIGIICLLVFSYLLKKEKQQGNNLDDSVGVVATS